MPFQLASCPQAAKLMNRIARLYRGFRRVRLVIYLAQVTLEFRSHMRGNERRIAFAIRISGRDMFNVQAGPFAHPLFDSSLNFVVHDFLPGDMVPFSSSVMVK